MRLRSADRADREVRAICFADFDLGFLVAIWLSLMSTTASGAATDTSPAILRGQEEAQELLLRTACSKRCRIMQTAGFVDQLLDVYRNGNTLRNPTRAGGSLGDLRRLTSAGADLAKASF
jgi:hypothetical protein